MFLTTGGFFILSYRLFKKHKQQKADSIQQKFKFFSVLSALSVFLLLLVSSYSSAQVPHLGNSYILSEKQEFNLGQAWIRDFKAKAPISYDVLVQDYLENLISNLIVFEKNLSIKKTQVLLIDDSSFNAFAVPGGIIGVNLGIFSYLPNEAELASVLAHEIGHISQHHFVRRLEGNKNLLAQQIFGLLSSAILAGITANSDVALAGITATKGAIIQNALYYSRTQEQEADRIGLQILKAAGYDAKSMAMAFGRMQHQIMLNGGNPPQFLLTHPLSETRIADINSRIDAQKPSFGTKKINTKSYALIRIRSMFLSFVEKEQVLASLKADGATKVELEFAQAMLAKERKNYASAISFLQNLLKKDKYNLILNYSLAEALFLKHNFKEAQNLLETVLDLSPNYYPALFLLGKIQSFENLNASQKTFAKLANLRPNDEQIWLELYDTSKFKKDALNTFYAKAEYMQLLGDFTSALEQMQLAKQVSKKYDFPAQARVIKRLEDLQTMAEDFSFK